MRPLPIARPTPVARLLATFAATATAVAAAFVLPLPAQAATFPPFGAELVGSGRGVDTVRRVGPFSALRMEGPLDVDAHPGAVPGVTVHADDNIEPLVETVLDGDTLVVRLRGGARIRNVRKTWVEVTYATLAASRQTGSGDLHVTRLDGPSFEASVAGSGDLRVDDAQVGRFVLRIAGSGDATLAGHAREVRFAVAGSGDIDAARLVARNADIAVDGSGDVRAHAIEAIAARVNGSGDVSYAGHPRVVSRSVSGTGSIVEQN